MCRGKSVQPLAKNRWEGAPAEEAKPGDLPVNGKTPPLGMGESTQRGNYPRLLKCLFSRKVRGKTGIFVPLRCFI